MHWETDPDNHRFLIHSLETRAQTTEEHIHITSQVRGQLKLKSDTLAALSGLPPGAASY